MGGLIGLGLSRELWILQAGILVNMLGYGAVLPFEMIYLHNGRGFSLGAAGIVVGTLSGVAVVAVPVAGPLIDLLGARVMITAAGLALAAGYAGLAFAVTPLQAIAAAAVAGIGNGALNPSQSTLVTALARPDMRHRVTAVARVSTNAGIGAGAAAGGVVASFGLGGLVVLLLANAATYLFYVAIVLGLVPEAARLERAPGGYGRVFRDRAFLNLAVVNIAMIAVGWGVFTWLTPPYARNTIGLDTHLIGLLLLANAATVVVLQVPIARLAEGRRRVHMIAIAGLIFCVACLVIAAAGLDGRLAFTLLLTASVAVGAGECFHTTALMPLVADLAPLAARGRYMASMGFSWWIGMTLGPALGAQVLGYSPPLAFLLSAAVVAVAAGAALRMEARLPAAARFTPRPAGRRA